MGLLLLFYDGLMLHLNYLGSLTSIKIQEKVGMQDKKRSLVIWDVEVIIKLEHLVEGRSGFVVVPEHIGKGIQFGDDSTKI